MISFLGIDLNLLIVVTNRITFLTLRCVHRLPPLVPFEFSLKVSLNSVTKIFVITVEGLEPATQPPLV